MPSLHQEERNILITIHGEFRQKEFHTNGPSLNNSFSFSQTDRQIQISYDIAHMWNIKKGTSELIYKTEMLQM